MAPAAAEQLVCLDVGGVRFTTALDTLTRYAGSYFARRQEWGGLTSSIAFVDRDPAAFAHVLTFLRYGPDVFWEAVGRMLSDDPAMHEKLRVDAVYYASRE